MRIHVKRPSKPASARTDASTTMPAGKLTSTALDTEQGATSAPNGEVPPSLKEGRVSQRHFLKLVGTAASLGLATQFASPLTAHAQNIGDPDTYLGGSLYGPGNGVLNLASSVQNSGSTAAFQFQSYPPGQSTFTNTISILNNGNLNMNYRAVVQALFVQTVAAGTSLYGAQMAGTLDLANYALNDVTTINAVATNSTPLQVAGYQTINLTSAVAGSLNWFGTNPASGSPLFSIDNAGNLTFSGTLKGGHWIPGSVIFINGGAGGNFGQDAAQFYWDNTNHRLGVGSGSWSTTVQPQATVSVVAAGASEIANGAASTLFRTSAGSLPQTPTTPATELVLTSLGFLATNSESLGVRAIRTGNGSDWNTTAIALGMDVDDTARDGAALWLYANGNLGVGLNGTVAIDNQGIAMSAHEAYYA